MQGPATVMAWQTEVDIEAAADGVRLFKVISFVDPLLKAFQLDDLPVSPIHLHSIFGLARHCSRVTTTVVTSYVTYTLVTIHYPAFGSKDKSC